MICNIFFKFVLCFYLRPLTLMEMKLLEMRVVYGITSRNMKMYVDITLIISSFLNVFISQPGRGVHAVVPSQMYGSRKHYSHQQSDYLP